MSDEKEILPVKEVELKTLTKDELITLCETKDNALKVAADTQEKIRMQLNQQVDMYNRDISYLSTINKNTVEYSRAKEDALIKIFEGALALMQLDRKPIAPKLEGEENK